MLARPPSHGVQERIRFNAIFLGRKGHATVHRKTLHDTAGNWEATKFRPRFIIFPSCGRNKGYFGPALACRWDPTHLLGDLVSISTPENHGVTVLTKNDSSMRLQNQVWEWRFSCFCSLGLEIPWITVTIVTRWRQEELPDWSCEFLNLGVNHGQSSHLTQHLGGTEANQRSAPRVNGLHGLGPIRISPSSRSWKGLDRKQLRGWLSLLGKKG